MNGGSSGSKRVFADLSLQELIEKAVSKPVQTKEVSINKEIVHNQDSKEKSADQEKVLYKPAQIRGDGRINRTISTAVTSIEKQNFLKTRFLNFLLLRIWKECLMKR